MLLILIFLFERSPERFAVAQVTIVPGTDNQDEEEPDAETDSRTKFDKKSMVESYHF